MKKLQFLLALLLALSFLYVSCATKSDVYIPTPTEEVYGIWVNPDYEDNSSFNEKMVFNRNGVLEEYIRASHEKPKGIASFRILEKWNDEQGNIIYRIRAEFRFGGAVYVLMRIFDSGQKLEFDFTAQTAEEIDPSHTEMYRVYKKI